MFNTLLNFILICILTCVLLIEADYNAGQEYAGHNHVYQDAHGEAARRHVEHYMKEMDPDHHVFKNDPKDMTPEEEALYWFASSDHDGDGSLDGHELLMALNDGLSPESGWSLEDSISHIELVMKEDDINKDGKISYEEFLASEARAQ